MVRDENSRPMRIVSPLPRREKKLMGDLFFIINLNFFFRAKFFFAGVWHFFCAGVQLLFFFCRSKKFYWREYKNYFWGMVHFFLCWSKNILKGIKKNLRVDQNYLKLGGRMARTTMWFVVSLFPEVSRKSHRQKWRPWCQQVWVRDL